MNIRTFFLALIVLCILIIGVIGFMPETTTASQQPPLAQDRTDPNRTPTFHATFETNDVIGTSSTPTPISETILEDMNPFEPVLEDDAGVSCGSAGQSSSPTHTV